jgi:hypothetical protein
MMKFNSIKPLAERAALGAIIAAPIALLVFALFILANFLSLGRDLPAAEAHVRAAYASGALQDVDWLPGNTDIGRHQYNDCLIIYMALNQQAGATDLMASPIKPMPRETETMCGALRAFVEGDRAAGRTGVWYHQYIHGHTMLARYLLPIVPVETMRNLFHTIQTLLVLSGVLLTMLALVRGFRPTESLFWLIVLLAFSRWFGLESYGQSLSHGPSDAIILVYLLFLAVSASCGGLSRWTSLVAAALFGSLTAIFEFLTGGIPLGLALIVGGLPFALRDGDPAEQLDRVVEAAAAFCFAVIACMALKLGLAFSVFGIDSFRESASQLQLRMGMGSAEASPGLLEAIKKLVKGINSIAAGMHVLAGATLLTAIGFGIWGGRLLMRIGDPAIRARTLHLAASNLVIVAMLLLLWQHTIVHAWFMERVFVWTIGTGFALFIFALRAQSRT